LSIYGSFEIHGFEIVAELLNEWFAPRTPKPYTCPSGSTFENSMKEKMAM